MDNIYITCVCEKCQHHEKSKPVLEINFHDKSIYWVCTACNFTNRLATEPEAKPLPKIGLMGKRRR